MRRIVVHKRSRRQSPQQKTARSAHPERWNVRKPQSALFQKCVGPYAPPSLSIGCDRVTMRLARDDLVCTDCQTTTIWLSFDRLSPHPCGRKQLCRMQLCALSLLDFSYTYPCATGGERRQRTGQPVEEGLFSAVSRNADERKLGDEHRGPRQKCATPLNAHGQRSARGAQLHFALAFSP